MDKDKILDEVKKGKSLRQTAKDNKLPLSTVAHWCREAGIKSKHTRTPSKATKDDIIEAIKKYKVMTQKDIEKKFKYTKNAIRRRLLKLVRKKEINYIVLSGGGGKVSEVFDGYIDKRLYYIDKKDLNEWLREKLPKYIPPGLKKAISQKLHNSGIDFEFERNSKKAIMVEKYIFKKIKEKAKTEGKSVTEFLNEVAD